MTFGVEKYFTRFTFTFKNLINFSLLCRHFLEPRPEKDCALAISRNDFFVADTYYIYKSGSEHIEY